MKNKSTNHLVTIPPEEFIKIVKDLVANAEAEGIPLRVMGAVAIYIHVSDNPSCIELYNVLGRLEDRRFIFTDLDLAGYRKFKGKVEEFFKKQGYRPDYYVNAFFSDRRLIFYHPEGLFQVDVFFSPLEFSHTVDIGSDPESGRLQFDSPTLPLADLLLLKLQIHDITRKDLVDAAVLVSCHEVSTSEERDKINAKRIAEVLSTDWGFWYDATSNLNELRKFIMDHQAKPENSQYLSLLKRGLENIEFILKVIEETPKSDKWYKRAKVGTKKIWYNIVEEI